MIGRVDAVRAADPKQVAQVLDTLRQRTTASYLEGLQGAARDAAVKMIKPKTNLTLARNAMNVDPAMAARIDKAAAASNAAAGAKPAQVTCEPAFDAFAKGYAAGQVQVVVQRLVDDLETPVSAYLKVAHGQPYSFLFESVEGGAWRGRLFLPGDGPRPGLALPGGTAPRSPRAMTSPPAASTPTATTRWSRCATWWRARGSICRAACRRWRPGCSA